MFKKFSPEFAKELKQTREGQAFLAPIREFNQKLNTAYYETWLHSVLGVLPPEQKNKVRKYVDPVARPVAGTVLSAVNPAGYAEFVLAGEYDPKFVDATIKGYTDLFNPEATPEERVQSLITWGTTVSPYVKKVPGVVRVKVNKIQLRNHLIKERGLTPAMADNAIRAGERADWKFDLSQENINRLDEISKDSAAMNAAKSKWSKWMEGVDRKLAELEAKPRIGTRPPSRLQGGYMRIVTRDDLHAAALRAIKLTQGIRENLYHAVLKVVDIRDASLVAMHAENIWTKNGIKTDQLSVIPNRHGELLTPGPYEKGSAGLVSAGREMQRQPGFSHTDGDPGAIVSHMADNKEFIFNKLTSEAIEAGKRWFKGAHGIAQGLSKKFNIELRQAAHALATFSPQTAWELNVARAERALSWLAKNPTVDTPAYRWLVGQSRKPKSGVSQRTLSLAASGRKLRDIARESPADAAWILRAIDEVHGEKTYRLVNSDGTLSNVVSRFGWGNTNPITKVVEVWNGGGSLESISANLGNDYKVPSFYNNIVDPDSALPSYTVDIHEVRAGVLQPTDTLLSKVFRSKDMYGLHSEAGRVVAAKYGLRPHEFQAAMWLAMRERLGRIIDSDPNFLNRVQEIWKKVDAGKLSAEEARARIWKHITEN